MGIDTPFGDVSYPLPHDNSSFLTKQNPVGLTANVGCKQMPKGQKGE